jgi:hypothetical protein
MTTRSIVMDGESGKVSHLVKDPSPTLVRAPQQHLTTRLTPVGCTTRKAARDSLPVPVEVGVADYALSLALAQQ